MTIMLSGPESAEAKILPLLEEETATTLFGCKKFFENFNFGNIIFNYSIISYMPL